MAIDRMARNRIRNPIIRGFNPDPSICRVGDDYYLATSTFEWYPGVQIYHSRDLEHWRLVCRPLNRPALLNMLGEPDSCGVWAPCLSWSDGKFWLLYTDVRRFDGNFKDTHNYLTTCETIDGDWEDPVYLNSSGFDPSMYHDDDGRKWYLNMVWDHRPDRSFFAGVVMQEYDACDQKLLGDRRFIFEGTDLDFTEAPHLYKRDGFYYLITAEGGTGYGHAVTMARSRKIDGPYEPDPKGSVVTARNNPEWPLQRAGHGDIVETQDGELYHVHLVGRPLPDSRLSPLGRETALAKIRYTEDGWFRLDDGSALPQLQVEPPDLPVAPVPPETTIDNFDSTELDSVYQWLRNPWPEEFVDLESRPGWLRLYGQESPGSVYRQALIARRQVDFQYEANTIVDFMPENFQQLAGLICYYNSSKFHYLYISADDEIGRHLGVMSCLADRSLATSYPIQDNRIELDDSSPIHLRASVAYDKLIFSWSVDGIQWRDIQTVLDYGVLADEAGMEAGEHFTGTFVGLCCNDLTGMRKHADFDRFSYRGLDQAPGGAATD